MRKTPQVPETRRRIPTQARADKTIETILVATAQILRIEGEARLTTNRIAERAGVSVGSLYQYFPHKEAILLALAERERHALVARISSELQSALPKGLEATARIVVRTLIATLAARQKGRKPLLLYLMRHPDLGKVSLGADALAQLLVGLSTASPSQKRWELDQTAAFVLTRAVQGVLRAAVLEEQSCLTTPALEDGLVRLIVAFLNDPTPAAP
jgi:AcrR family transcriptional regulator